MEVSRRDIFLALAREVPNPAGGGELIENPYRTWKDVNEALPDHDIVVLGPPPTSGTRDAFAELALEGGCKTFDFIKAMKKKDKKAYKAVCHSIPGGRRLRRGGRERQPHRPEARSRPERVRGLRVQLPRPEPGQAPGLDDRRSGARVRGHRGR